MAGREQWRGFSKDLEGTPGAKRVSGKEGKENGCEKNPTPPPETPGPKGNKPWVGRGFGSVCFFVQSSSFFVLFWILGYRPLRGHSLHAYWNAHWCHSSRT